MSRWPASVDDAATRLGSAVRRDVPLGPLTTYRVGGPAALFVEVNSEDELRTIGDVVLTTGLPVLVIGRGSNLLVSDRGFAGVAITMGEGFNTIEIDGTQVRAGAAVSLPVLARRTAAAGLTGFEWAVGVPGSIGGAVRMNAGGHGSDMRKVLRGYRFVDLHGGIDGDADVSELGLRYRGSSVEPYQVVTFADIELARGDVAESETRIAEIVRWRRENQPGGQNAGSVFVNPPDDSAGRLVEASGSKGFRLGSAQVSDKHANFVQADPDGSADDVWRLIQEVRRRVLEQTGVSLRPELRLIGFPERES